jgi:hypothetical protein
MTREKKITIKKMIYKNQIKSNLKGWDWKKKIF